MVKIIGNDLTRDGQKIGWISGNDIVDGGAYSDVCRTAIRLLIGD